MILISNLVLNISDEGSAIAATNIYSTKGTEDKKTYINIGSGNVFNLSWAAPALTNENDTIDHYNLVIKRHDIALNVYYDIFDKNIGLVNSFRVDSSLLPSVPAQYKLSVYLVAYGKQGSIVTSNIVTPYISRGSGTYVKAQPEGYKQPVMKRALAFTYPTEVLTDAEGNALVDSEELTVHALDTDIDKPLYTLKDRNGRSLLAKNEGELLAPATRVLENVNGWTVVQEGYTRDANGDWRANDIRYEVLVAPTGENSEELEIVEVLENGKDEPLYLL